MTNCFEEWAWRPAETSSHCRSPNRALWPDTMDEPACDCLSVQRNSKTTGIPGRVFAIFTVNRMRGLWMHRDISKCANTCHSRVQIPVKRPRVIAHYLFRTDVSALKLYFFIFFLINTHRKLVLPCAFSVIDRHWRVGVINYLLLICCMRFMCAGTLVLYNTQIPLW